MGTNTLETAYANGQIIDASHINELTSSLLNSVVGRNSSGTPEAGKSLGTIAIPWGNLYTNAIILNGLALDVSQLVSPPNRIISGKKRSASNQPQFITPNGAAASFILEGATTNLILDVNGEAVTVSTDIPKTGLTVGPSTTATCLIDELTAADQAATRVWGEYGSEKPEITVDNMGVEFQSFIGQYMIVKIAGTSDEYALVYVKSATKLSNCLRGFSFNSSGAPIQRAVFSNNDVVTVLSTGWVFVEDNGTTVDVSYTTPVRSHTAPATVTGAYWYDMQNQVWKRYDGAEWVIINRTLVAVVGIDSANCVCARSFDFHKAYSDTNNIELEISSTEIILGKDKNQKVSVYGNEIQFGFNFPSWNITTQLALVGSADTYNVAEQASTVYYLYIKDTGQAVISDVEPQYRQDLSGWYNPHNPWRCVGEAYNNSSSNLVMVDELEYNPNISEKIVYIKDIKAATTNGGTHTSGSLQTRVLNTVEGASEIVSLDSNQFRLLSGKYDILSFSNTHGTDNTKSVIYNETDTAVAILGSTVNAASTASNAVSIVTGDFLITSPKAYTLKSQCQTTGTNTGFGQAAGAGGGLEETFAQVKITKTKRVG